MNGQRNTPLTDYQRSVIKHLLLDGKSLEEIQQKSDLQRPDGSPILLSTLKYWAKRLAATGDVKVKRRLGRPKLLNQLQEKNLVHYIKSHSGSNYSEVKQNTQFQGHRRTLNNYALKNKIRKFQIVHLLYLIKWEYFQEILVEIYFGQWLIE